MKDLTYMTARATEVRQFWDNRQTHVVVGYGEVGKAIGRVLEDGGADPVAIHDPRLDHFCLPARGEVVHICFPYDDSFVTRVKALTNASNLVIVHSTVLPGTCDKFGWVHSPVNGKHPNLYGDIKRFVKWFGGGRSAEAGAIFRNAGLEVLCLPRALTCELAKVLDTTRYGWEIMWHKEAARLCERYGEDWDTVLTEWTRTYNDGYAHYDDERSGLTYRRSTLFPLPGPIGGHCVIPNLDLLPDDFVPAAVIRAQNDTY